MKLYGVESDVLDDLGNLMEVVIDEDADFQNAGWQLIGNQSRLARLDKPTTFVKEIQADRIGPRVGSRPRIGEIRKAANFDPAFHAFIIRRAAVGGLA
jgi:hypothetical protein